MNIKQLFKKWRRKGFYHIGDDTYPIRVSTIRIPEFKLDDGRQVYPEIFETIIFLNHHTIYEERYKTLEEAEKGHKQCIANLGKTI